MRISKDGFKVKETISHFEYIDIVNEIVENTFFTDDDGNITEYAPHFLSMLLPTIFVDHCVDGVELDEEEKKDVTKYIEAISANKELYSTVCDAIDGIEYTNGGLRYFYNAMEDAEKIIQVKLQEFSPANKFLKSITYFTDTINKQFDGVDVKEFVKTLEMIANTSEPRIEAENTKK